MVETVDNPDGNGSICDSEPVSMIVEWPPPPTVLARQLRPGDLFTLGGCEDCKVIGVIKRRRTRVITYSDATREYKPVDVTFMANQRILVPLWVTTEVRYRRIRNSQLFLYLLMGVIFTFVIIAFIITILINN